MRNKMRQLCKIVPRVKNKIHKTYDVTAERSYNVVFWAVCVTLMYGYVLQYNVCLLYTSPSPRDKRQSRMPSSA